MVIRTKTLRKISMGFLTGTDLVDVKPGDHIFEYGGEAWFFKKLGEVPTKNYAWPIGVLAYVGPNAQNEGKWFGDISCPEEFGDNITSDDFDSYEEAMQWTIENLEKNKWV